MTAGLFAIALGCLAAALYYYGWSFYSLPVQERASHPNFRSLSPGGLVGHGYGIAGFALMLTNLLYLVRRKFAGLQLGPLKTWLNIHVVTGLTGALLVLFHSAFQSRNPIATITSVSLVLLVLTGIIGRYLYSIAPKPDHRRISVYWATLDSYVPGLSEEVQRAIGDRRTNPLPANAGLVRALLHMPALITEGARRKRIVKKIPGRTAHLVSKPERKNLRKLCRRFAYTINGDLRSEAGTAVLRGWRGLHRFFAILMILSVAIHIAVAWYYGYRWILS
ncbi:MAG: hypothetical protein IPJ88_12645 [Myxococcales bacterium]|nr:MAG: hypothetical protein IPJ88_12645 [Myxococcales bacterium]